LNSVKEILERYSLSGYVDKAIVSGNIIETIAKRIVWFDGRVWTSLNDQEKEQIRERTRLEHHSRAYSLSLDTPLGKVGIIAMEYVEKPNDFFIHDVLHETLHIKQFEDYPNLKEFTDKVLGQAYEKYVGIKPNYQQMVLLRSRKRLLMDIFLEKEILKIDTKIAFSAIIRELKEWVKHKANLFEWQDKNKNLAIVALERGILQIYLRFRYLQSETEEVLIEIS